MSCTKGATAAVVHRLAERGLIDYEAPVADYWPEFAAGGKGDARIWHLMSHSVGLPGVDPESGVTAHDMLYARPPRAGAGSHGAGVGAGRLLPLPPDHLRLAARRGRAARDAARASRRCSPRRSPRRWGSISGSACRRNEEPRVAPHFQPTPGLTAEQITALIAGMGIDVTTRLAKVVLHSLQHTAELIEDMNNREARAAEVPAGNGIADAASLAKMYAAMIGEVDGVRLLKPETVEKARTLRTGAMSPAGDFAKLQFGAPTRYGLGYEFARDVTADAGPGLVRPRRRRRPHRLRAPGERHGRRLRRQHHAHRPARRAGPALEPGWASCARRSRRDRRFLSHGKHGKHGNARPTLGCHPGEPVARRDSSGTYFQRRGAADPGQLRFAGLQDDSGGCDRRPCFPCFPWFKTFFDHEPHERGPLTPLTVIAGRQSRRPMNTVVRVAAPGAAMARGVFMGGRDFARP